MILEIIHAILGLVFTLFLPGFLLTKIIFRDIDILETIAFSVVFSIAFSIALELFLGANKTMYDLTGGITEFNLWFYEIGFTIIFFCIFLVVQNRRAKQASE